jgi:hypothetical protein
MHQQRGPAKAANQVQRSTSVLAPPATLTSSFTEKDGWLSSYGASQRNRAALVAMIARKLPRNQRMKNPVSPLTGIALRTPISYR